MPRLLSLAAKLGLSAGLIWFTFSKLDAGAAVALIGDLPGWAIAGGMALAASQFLFVTLRMCVLLGSLGSPIRFGSALDAVMIGTFFSQTMISFVGGDAMRIWRLTHRGTPMGDAARAVLYDRVFGFLGLMLLIGFGLPLLFRTVEDSRVHVAILALMVVTAAGCLFLLSLHWLPERLRRGRLMNFAGEIGRMGHELLRRPAMVAKLLAYSVAVQALNVGAMYCVALGLGVAVDLRMLFALVPPVMFLSMMPISFAGWGIRESAMVAALATVGVSSSHSLAISISYGVGLAIVSLPGAACWLVARRVQPAA